MKRYTKVHSSYGGNRPIGIFNIVAKTIDSNGQLPEGFEELIPISVEDKRHIGYLLLCSPTIVRIGDINQQKRKQIEERLLASPRNTHHARIPSFINSGIGRRGRERSRKDRELIDKPKRLRDRFRKVY